MLPRIIGMALCVLLGEVTVAQLINQVILPGEVVRIESVLSSDEMQGRAVFTPGIDKAADFISAEFKKAGIHPVKNESYFQDFELLRTKFISVQGLINGHSIESKNIVVKTVQSQLAVSEAGNYEQIVVGSNDTLWRVINALQATGKHYLVVIDTMQAQNFNRLKRTTESLPQTGNFVFVLTNEIVSTFNIQFRQEATLLVLKNVVGMIPGKKLKNEYVIFSAHYDHLGIRRANKDNDSIYNGANDDASGVTAVIMLANYFSQLKQNDRTLVFAAFTAEETGGYGAQYFSTHFSPEKVIAMFNIEMIGTDSRWGTNAAYLTGYDKSSMGAILEKNLQGSAFQFYPDPYPEQQLFYRSDNATLARLGVPAHTISTSKMDTNIPEPYYHTADDEIETLNMKNMTEIIKAIALSSVSIVEGRDTPSRVNANQLR